MPTDPRIPGSAQRSAPNGGKAGQGHRRGGRGRYRPAQRHDGRYGGDLDCGHGWLAGQILGLGWLGLVILKIGMAELSCELHSPVTEGSLH